MKKLLLVFTILSSFFLAGCDNSYKGSEFVGHWYEESKKEHPGDIKITYDDGIFHLDVNEYSPFEIVPEYKMHKLEAKADSNSVLSGNGQMFPFSMRLENGKLNVGNKVYVKK